MHFSPISRGPVIAAELRDLARRIEAASMALCSDPALVRIHLPTLQLFDEIAQTQNALADLIAEETGAAVPISLDALESRLSAYRP